MGMTTRRASKSSVSTATPGDIGMEGSAPMPWRNRIIGHGMESPDQLLANPRNFRIHPKAQQDALAGVLSEVGWVQDIIVNQRTQHVIDGHARVALAISRNEPTVPVVYVDLDEREEAIVLATLDPLSAMAGRDGGILADLVAGLEVGDSALAEMLAGLGGGPVPEFLPVGEDEQGRLDQKAPTTCPECGHVWTA